MEPTIPSGDGLLEDLAKELVGKSARLAGMLHPLTREAVVDLLRLINSYYSNLIEGNNTEPAEIERAMRRDYAQDPARRNLQLESLAHVHVQREMEKKLAETPDLDPSDPGFLCWLHQVFYARIPEELHWVASDAAGERVQVVGGELRRREVQVGLHHPPGAQELDGFLRRFAEAYRRGRHHGIRPIVAAAAAHHRLLWIHPFMDGNGRVARLYTDASLRLNLEGYGLWNVSRGFARQATSYKAALSQADAGRRNDLDGRGNLSHEGLTAFCRFFLETCHDQVDFMTSLLRLDGIIERIRGYVQLRAAKIIPSPRGEHRGMKPEAAGMIEAVLLRGEMARGEIAAATGSSRTGRDILPQLLAEGILVAKMPKGPVRLAFPTHFAGYLFPDLYPGRILPR